MTSLPENSNDHRYRKPTFDVTTTLFAGVAFPSTLHAQWALFFESLAMPWRFRPRAFSFTDGHGYQPDFWLPQHRLWFQVGGDVTNSADLRRWVSFAEAADDELYDVREATLDRSWCPDAPHPIAALPPQWRAMDALYAVGGIPDPDQMTSQGPSDGGCASMYTACDRGYQWTVCPSCGYIGAAFEGRSDRLACGHGDRERDSNYRADDPKILSAYQLARQATTARTAGGCARCTGRVNIGDLVVAGRPIGNHHAACDLAGHRKRNQDGSLPTDTALALRDRSGAGVSTT